jgi:hypothetical protein
MLRNLLNEDLNNFCSSPNKIRMFMSRRILAGNVAYMGDAYRDCPENTKRPLERPRRRQEDNIKMDLREIG